VKKAIVGIGVFALIIGILLIALPFVYVPKTTSEAYRVPKSMVILEGWMPLAAVGPFKSAAKGADLNAGDSLNIQVNATSGKGIDFSVNAVNDATGDVLATYLFYPDVTTVNKDWIVPLTSAYNFVFNSSSLFTYKDVTLLVTKQWTETAYRDVTQNVQLLPFEFSYVGVVLSLAGIGILIYGIVKKEASKNSSGNQYTYNQNNAIGTKFSKFTTYI
jgi:hypothetical protein